MLSSRTQRRVFIGTVAFATMRGKEEAIIAPVLLRELGLPVYVCSGIDTDLLGTFTGETQRIGSARDAALAKARLALHAEPGSTYGVGSESSFGPHPSMPFITAGCEIVVLLSRDDEFVLFGTDVTSEMKCAEVKVTTTACALEVAQQFDLSVSLKVGVTQNGFCPGLTATRTAIAARLIAVARALGPGGVVGRAMVVSFMDYGVCLSRTQKGTFKRSAKRRRASLERWQSGRMHSLGKRADLHGSREFESPLLRVYAQQPRRKAGLLSYS